MPLITPNWAFHWESPDHENFNVPFLGSLVLRLTDTAGRYQVYSGCTGGNMSLMVGRLSAQYEFVFADANYYTLFLLSTTTTGTGISFGGPALAKTDILNGVMKRW